MNILVDNCTFSLRISLTMLRFFGFWIPDNLNPTADLLYRVYCFLSFMAFVGVYIVTQMVDLALIWGDLPLMTGTAFLLFTNLAQTLKFFVILRQHDVIQNIINEADLVMRSQDSKESRDIVAQCNKETTFQQLFFFALTTVTVAGWAGSAETNQLPLRAWYPYDTSRSPAYELTYAHQTGALFGAAFLNICKDTLVTSLIAQTRCRLKLLSHSLRTLGRGISSTEHEMLSASEEYQTRARLGACVQQHQEALAATQQLQRCFSAPTFMQFSVTVVIICVTAFQLAAVAGGGNLVRLVSMGTYLLDMMVQLLLYCYQGHMLLEESTEVSGAAFESGWHRWSPSLRRSLLPLMMRCRRPATLKAGGFTTLSLSSYMAVIKTSYSMFTLLQKVQEKS